MYRTILFIAFFSIITKYSYSESVHALNQVSLLKLVRSGDITVEISGRTDGVAAEMKVTNTSAGYLVLKLIQGTEFDLEEMGVLQTGESSLVSSQELTMSLLPRGTKKIMLEQRGTTRVTGGYVVLSKAAIEFSKLVTATKPGPEDFDSQNKEQAVGPDSREDESSDSASADTSDVLADVEKVLSDEEKKELSPEEVEAKKKDLALAFPEAEPVPPSPVDEETVAPPRQRPEHTHGGFFLRLSVDVGYHGIKTTVADEETDLRGFLTLLGIHIGGTIRGKITIHGTFEVPISFISGDYVSAGSTDVVGFFTGPGITFYGSRSNVFFTGVLGVASLKFKSAELDSAVPADIVSDAPGFGFSLSVGKEWWVTRSWGAGLGMTFFWSHATVDGTGANPDAELRQFMLRAGLTLTYN